MPHEEVLCLQTLFLHGIPWKHLLGFTFENARLLSKIILRLFLDLVLKLPHLDSIAKEREIPLVGRYPMIYCATTDHDEHSALVPTLLRGNEFPSFGR